METESFVNIFATVPFSLKISIQDGVMLVSRKELAIPLMMARAYPRYIFDVKVTQIRKIA